ncbi:MAG: ligase-associated DNA damage response endonuclease PdeM, partial [Phycisphaerales bacterium]|nr:ligase-associated DNA damage response endonuclease PdeM [Phycisphaerales bacterium]
ERLTLLGSRALWWPAQRALIVADLHLGKPATFRALGVPAPEAVTAADLARLDQALDAVGAPRLFILGDLLHAAAGRAPCTLEAVANWRSARPALHVLVIRGNHDRRAGDPPHDWRFECADGPFPIGPFDLIHEPEQQAGRPALAGHIHPAVAAAPSSGPGRLRPPCFWISHSLAVLPAFGGFTGCRAVRAARGDRLFAVGDGSVVEVPSR